MKNFEFELLSKSKLLYIAEKSSTSRFVTESLNEVFEVINIADSTSKALEIYYNKKPDFILTDINFPKMNIINFIQNLRKYDRSTQIALTYSYSDMYKVLNVVELDISKILVKPLTKPDLELLLIAFSRRYKVNESYELAPFWKFEPNSYQIISPSFTFTLTKKECTFLSFLVKKKKIVTYTQMKHNLWIYSEMNDNVIHTFIKNIRKKLPKRTLITVKGVGYKLSNYQEKVKT